jgi:hypothetical protein
MTGLSGDSAPGSTPGSGSAASPSAWPAALAVAGELKIEVLVRPGDLLHDWDGALAHERDRHGMGAHAVARDAAGGVGGGEES